MKDLIILLMVAPLLIVGCQQTNSSLSVAEKNEIETAIKVVFDRMVEGMNEHDADKIASCYLKNKQFRYAGEGTLETDWESGSEGMYNWHADPAHREWSITIEETIVDVLSREMVVITARGTAYQPDETGKKIQRGYSVTDIFQRQEDGWIIINEHESVGDPKSDET